MTILFIILTNFWSNTGGGVAMDKMEFNSPEKCAIVKSELAKHEPKGYVLTMACVTYV